MRPRRGSAALLLVCLGTLTTMCARKDPDVGGLMLEIVPDGTLSIDAVQVDIRAGDRPLLRREYRIPAEKTLPNTIAIASNGDPSATVAIAVSAFHGEGSSRTALDRRDNIVTQIPTDRVVAFRVVLSARCTPQVRLDLVTRDAVSSCPGGTTCSPSSGACIEATVRAVDLPLYVPGGERDASFAPADTGPTPAADGSLARPDATPDAAPPVDEDAGDAGACAAGTKRCASACSPADVAHGCASASSCAACTAVVHGVAGCDASGQCGIASCDPGYKACGGSCVAISDPAFGCGATTCDRTSCVSGGGIGTFVCNGNVCTTGTCPAGTKVCDSACVPTDESHGCQGSACTACARGQVCTGGPPTACACVPDPKSTTCAGKCGVVPNNCGLAVDCGDTCGPPQSSCASSTSAATTVPTCNASNVCETSVVLTQCAPGQSCVAGACEPCNTAARCGPSCAACGGAQPFCTQAANGFACAACVVDGDCPAGVCAGGACMSSCAAADPSCGTSTENAPCCQADTITGGSFNRSNDPAYPAYVSTFRLDHFEVNVRRFRRFVDAWVAGWRPAQGAGKHAPLNGGAGLSTGAGTFERGWDKSWDANLPATKAEWDALFCNVPERRTWTASPADDKENLPMNCLAWFDAYAFCIFDGGFLPSEAEWNYAAAVSPSGTYSTYPWGSSEPGPDPKLAIWGCYYSGGPSTCGLASIAPVGTAFSGASSWGPVDMAGSVHEWTLDSYTEKYGSASCVDCATLGTNEHVYRGGAFDNMSVTTLQTQPRQGLGFARSYQFGVRCARKP
jgi:formylglycine-generating enzyme required for sulfatase activity